MSQASQDKYKQLVAQAKPEDLNDNIIDACETLKPAAGGLAPGN